MSIARSLLLKASDSPWLRENAARMPFVRRAVSRFMPGEGFDDMLAAARTMAAQGVATVFTRLGENVSDQSEADAWLADLQALDAGGAYSFAVLQFCFAATRPA